ncbi:MAG: CDP-alcohol phosphatidyltransferase family protein [Deltaproteobacteria bacterium]|nr:CDP-alcohol phosphatidyltransferase family protein [Deltaproteobacteria bacterium]MBW2140412.1 CDP-alcohol phosphatidyltransferase family protein [Deltaproteobacteria bacterium]MBW2323713.1 CDP-alcohol phosphatidyltransferase family protein [Deltaproteobacteria bacterium]
MSQPAEHDARSHLGIAKPAARAKAQTKKIFIHYFGAKEKKSIDTLTSLRDSLCQGLANWLIRHNISPKRVTLLSFLIQLIFFPLFFALKWMTCAFLVLVVHIILDGLDGPVARTKKVESNSGALADILNDTTGLVIVGLSIIFFGDINYQGLTAAYITLYLYHTAFNIVLNFYQRPFVFVIHTKFIFFFLVLLKYLFNFDILPIFFVISTAYMAVSCVFGMLRIFDALDFSDNLTGTPTQEETDGEQVEIKDHLAFGGK